MTNEELISKIKDFANEQKELLNGFELQSDFRRGETAAYSAIISFLDTLESERPMNPDDAMKELDEKIALVKQRGTWDGVDVDKYMDEVRGGVSDDLEEAAGNIYKTPFGTRAEDFKAGAEWQKGQDLAEMAQSKSPLSVAYANRCFENGKQAMKEQMMKGAVEGEVYLYHSYNRDATAILVDIPKENLGDKVRVIVCKKEDEK